MQETELKFQVGEGASQAVEKAVHTASARRTRLQARYFDTDGHALAAAGIALRLRKEGRLWVQTVKAGGSDAMVRLEHNVSVGAREPPGVDLQLHGGSPAADVLAAALAPRDGQPPPRLRETFRTDVWRTHRVLRANGGSVELAFDRGRIVAGERELPVCELEIELLHGASRAVIEAARRFVVRHGLWLDTRSKAERGDRLGRDDATGKPTKAGASPWHEHMPVHTAWRAALGDCLAQILPNASQIASGAYTQEHVHQWRVGVRRLRSMLRFARERLPESATAWDEALSALSVRIGATRDRDVLAASLEPSLHAAGAPPVQWPAPGAADDPATLLRGVDTNVLWLDLLAAAHDESATAHADEPSLADEAAARLRRWHRNVVRDWKLFPELSDEARHTVRKRAKRLRYAAEFAAPLYASKAVERYLKKLRPLQESLGSFNDLSVANVAYRGLADTDARAWFAVGWIAARREVVLADCAKALRRFSRAKPFWKE